MQDKKKWQFWIDRGGTFTDVVAQSPDDALTSHKYLSVNPEFYDDAAVFAMRDIMGVDTSAPFPSADVHSIKMGTTVATNALLERDGEKTLFVTTQGFADVLLIGQQHRTDLFALKPTRPAPLYSDVLEVPERILADGTIRLALDTHALTHGLEEAFNAGIGSVAIAFVHGYRYTQHEEIAAAIAREIGFTQISVSHQVSPLMKLVPRGDTTVADAYLSPVLRHYVDKVKNAVGDVPLYFMQSNGGLAEAGSFMGKDAVLSGPAGGIVGAAKCAAQEGHSKVIGFDMGGTSTDVSHYAGRFERVFDTVVAGVRMTVPMMDIHTVAAGGGSICKYADGRFQVGPDSAGSNPGPACYGRGGPVTVTDCNLLLGRLQPHLFPAVFGKDGKQPLDIHASRTAFQHIASQIAAEQGKSLSLEAIAEGFLAVAVEHMARAIKRVSVERGHNIRDYSLLTFGGAGGQHACQVADALGIETVLVPPFSGVLSALGMGLAEQRTIAEQAVEEPIAETKALDRALRDTTEQARNSLAGQNVSLSAIETVSHVRIKYEGTDTCLSIPFGNQSEMESAFARLHKTQFGFTEPDTPLIAEAVETEAIARTANAKVTAEQPIDLPGARGDEQTYQNGWHPTPILSRDALTSHSSINGPAIILEKGGTTVLERGWSAESGDHGSIILRRLATKIHAQKDTKTADPVLLEIFNNLFMSVAEEMGGVLAKTAHSVNVKERLDFSCAVFDAEGRLVANAPHMPVHLGSMGDSVTAILEARAGQMQAGDVFMVNDPSAGGTHLPDITVITPVFYGESDHPTFFVASRGHHADVGGISPGSMPSNSQTLEEEGVCFTNFHLVKAGQFQTEAVRDALTGHVYPARNPAQNIADLKAQVAANARGVALVEGLVDYYSLDTVNAYMGFVRQNAADAVRSVIARIKSGQCRYEMDCGGTIKVQINPSADKQRLVIDFSGSSPALSNNYNAPFAVVKAAVLYVFRVLTGSDIPLNAGCLEPIDIIAPENSMIRPPRGAAVVAGNVETSQAITNALFIATGTMAAAQGTMNNLTFGNDHYQYYETIAGGTGAGNGFDGSDAIQAHMTNSRLTDVEVMEWRYPVVIREFGVRRGSGGSGLFSGGNGIKRAIEFLEPMDVSLLANHYRSDPPGLSGGCAGQRGTATVFRTNGEAVHFQAADQAKMTNGDVIAIETPGGGGYGKPND